MGDEPDIADIGALGKGLHLVLSPMKVDPLPPPRDDGSPPHADDGASRAPGANNGSNGKGNGKSKEKRGESGIRPILAALLIPRIVAGAKAPRISTPFPRLDAAIGGGLRMKTITAIISGVGMGKSSLALAIGYHHARTGPVLYNGLEVPPEHLAARVIGQVRDRRWADCLDGLVSEVEMHEALDGLELYFLPKNDDPIVAIAESLDSLPPGVPKLLVIDYAQLLADLVTARGDMRVAVATGIDRLRQLVEGRDDTACLLVSQSSRAGARQIKDNTGDASELVGVGGESSAIEQAVVNQIVLSFTQRDGVSVHDVTVNLSKCRFGTRGKVALRFHGASGRWEELDAVPATESQMERREEILDSLRAAGGGPLSKSKIISRAGADGKKQKLVHGDKGVVLREIDAMVREGLIREAGGGYWADAEGPV